MTMEIDEKLERLMEGESKWVVVDPYTGDEFEVGPAAAVVLFDESHDVMLV